MRLCTAMLSISTLLLFGTLVQAAQPPDAAQVTRMRAALQTVLAADCDSLTDCTCGLATSLPG